MQRGQRRGEYFSGPVLGGEHITIMPRPLVQKICEFCAKTFSVAPERKNRLCPMCTENRETIKRYIQAESKFSIHIPEEGNCLYEPVYHPVVTGGVLVGYISESTGIFFIGRIVELCPGKVITKPVSRICGTKIHDNHNVPYTSLKCTFRIKSC